MIRRSTAAALALAALTVAPIATAADLKANINAASQQDQPLAGTITRLFAKSTVEVEQQADGMLVAPPVFPHVMVLAITPEGETESGCVDNAHSAAKVLARGNAKIERPEAEAKATTPAGKGN
ncbi:MAG TPA: hypothetical protein VF698_10270 [Thermoanaerobaculia bacterium]|jgi:hypothetical protein